MFIAELVSLRLDSAAFLLLALLLVLAYHLAHRRELGDTPYPRAFFPALVFLAGAALLAAEGVERQSGQVVDFARVRYAPQ